MKNWVDLQDAYRCHYFIADLHALTTDYADTSAIREATLEAATDWLSVGLDPEKSVLFVQSRVPQTAELALVFGMITPLGWLERVPTYKEQIEQLREKDLGTFGFLGYPVLMTADIALFLADYVPVGKDQESHLEICREIVRRFNGFYGDVFPEPQAALHGDAEGAGARRPEDVEELREHDRALRRRRRGRSRRSCAMVTDPKRARRSDPGDPETLQPLSVPPPLLQPRRGRAGRRGVPDGGARLRRLQEAPHPEHERRPRAGPCEARRDHVEAGLRPGGPRSRERAGAGDRGTDDGDASPTR